MVGDLHWGPNVHQNNTTSNPMRCASIKLKLSSPLLRGTLWIYCMCSGRIPTPHSFHAPFFSLSFYDWRRATRRWEEPRATGAPLAIFIILYVWAPVIGALVFSVSVYRTLIVWLREIWFLCSSCLLSFVSVLALLKLPLPIESVKCVFCFYNSAEAS